MVSFSSKQETNQNNAFVKQNKLPSRVYSNLRCLKHHGEASKHATSNDSKPVRVAKVQRSNGSGFGSGS